MSRTPAPDDGPRRFILTWLTYNGDRPPRTRTLWKLGATVLILLAATALLALFNGYSRG